jgi:hypothetical protein
MPLFRVSRLLTVLHQQWQTLVQGRSRYPLFRQELAYWDARLGGRWRIEEAFAVVTLGNLCLLPIALLIYPN